MPSISLFSCQLTKKLQKKTRRYHLQTKTKGSQLINRWYYSNSVIEKISF